MAKQRTNKDIIQTSDDKLVNVDDTDSFERRGEFMRTGHDVRIPPAEEVTHDDLGLSENDVIDMYENMVLQRQFERRAKQMYLQGKISGFLHLYIGQEAVSTGSVWAVNDDDPLITAYRDHGLGLARGMDPNACMAELYGRIDGCSRGKGGSMHFFSKEHEFYGGHGIVGAGIPLGVGIAFALKYKDTDRACLNFFGDGAINIGAFHEAANLAGLYELPVVLICENNEYGMGTSYVRSSAEPELYRRAGSYRMTGRVVNGMDVFSVFKAIREHAEMARQGKPSLLEVRTYRYEGHSMTDPADYRSQDELEEHKEGDAILRLKDYILEHSLADEDRLAGIEDEIKERVKEAADFAENSDFPPIETIYEDVYSQKDYPFLTD